MGFVFFLVCGFITASLVKPLIYYILYIKGGFPIDDTECDRFGINTIWCVVSGALLFISTIIGAIDGWNLAFKIGCILGMLFSVVLWLNYLFHTVEGHATTMYMDIKIIEKTLYSLDRSYIGNDEKEKADELVDKLMDARKKINEYVIAKCEKRTEELFDEINKEL